MLQMQRTTGTVIAFDSGRGLSGYIAKMAPTRRAKSAWACATHISLPLLTRRLSPSRRGSLASVLPTALRQYSSAPGCGVCSSGEFCSSGMWSI